MQFAGGPTRCRRLQIEHPNQLLVAARHQELAVIVERHRLDDVLVLEAVHLLAGDRVPYLAGEVGCTGRGQARLLVERHTPDSALVALERAHPVTGVALPQHGIAI